MNFTIELMNDTNTFNISISDTYDYNGDQVSILIVSEMLGNISTSEGKYASKFMNFYNETNTLEISIER